MKAQADGDDGKEFDQGKGSATYDVGTKMAAPIMELMRQCWGAGAHPPGGDYDPHHTWDEWREGAGHAHLAAYCDSGAMTGMERTINDVHTVLAANNAMLTTMIEAMQEMEPDDTVDEEGEVWTLTATTDAGIQLCRTVRSVHLKPAIAAAVLAWGHGSWESLLHCRAVCED